MRKCQAGNQAPLLEPEDRCERPGEEDSLDGGEGRLLVGDPTHGPVGLVLDAGDGLDSIKGVFTGQAP